MMSASFNGFLDFVNGTTVGGWAWDSRTPNDPVVVEISRDGQIIATAPADRFREDLRVAGFGNGRHSFEIELPAETVGVDVPEPLVFSARIEGSGYELNRSPFRYGPARREAARPRDAVSSEIQGLHEDIAAFSRAWKRNDNLANRLASLSARDGGLTRVAARPQWFMIETTSHCNLKCVMCPHGHDAMPHKSHLDTSRFSKSFDFLAVADRMQLFGTGEPLLSEAFWEILESIDPESGTEVSINSNGTLLNQERIDRLLRSPLSWISISLDAARPETYRRIRGADFDVVIARVKDFIRERNARRTARSLRIFINMTLMRANIREFPAFVDLAAEIGADGVQVNQLLWHQEHCSWEIQKGDWHFVYRDQLLRTSIEEVNECIREAIERGAARHVPVFFDFSQFEGTTPIVHEEHA
jgi:molybdenum cofactor biosynthesis enzyme MoaA